DIAKVVDAKAKIALVDTIVRRDKVIVEGEVTVQVLYVADLPGRPVHFFHTTFSFLQIVNLFGAEPGMEAFVSFDVEHLDVEQTGPRSVDITLIVETRAALATPWCL
ncbi:MAG: hypothetical protein PWQ82_997, partial [Thermosediminibacterales bacterium]|nr:hypothetical protein [Thermosediminibacterales bacterium]